MKAGKRVKRRTAAKTMKAPTSFALSAGPARKPLGGAVVVPNDALDGVDSVEGGVGVISLRAEDREIAVTRLH